MKAIKLIFFFLILGSSQMTLNELRQHQIYIIFKGWRSDQRKAQV